MKVGVIGCGFVGSTAAFAMILTNAVNEVVLIDVNMNLASAQAEDILHATPFTTPVKVFAGNYEDLDGADVVVLACGVGQKPGETRLQLLERNVKIFENVVPKVLRHAQQTILLVASNPVDIITNVTAKIAGMPPQRIIGSGTILDTARFRALLGDSLNISPRSVHAYVIGEHGDSEVFVWSSGMVGGIPLAEFAKQVGRPVTQEVMDRIDERVRRAAYRIIEGKGATYYGIGAGISRIVSAIRYDEQVVLTVSAPVTDMDDFRGISFSLPRIVGGSGIASTFRPVLSDKEYKAIGKSIEVLRESAKQIGY